VAELPNYFNGLSEATMTHVKHHKQLDMLNPFEAFGPKRLVLLESFWAHLFREQLLHKLAATLNTAGLNL